jgi:hypothetical protein
LLAGLLAGSHYASGRSYCRPSRRRFSWFSTVYKEMLRWFSVCNLLLSAPHAAIHLKSTKTEHHSCHSHQNCVSKLCSLPLIQETKFCRPCSKPRLLTFKVFAFTLLLLEGRVGEAWEHSNKVMLCLFPFSSVSFLP